MSLEQIHKVVGSLSKLVEDNEKIAIPIFAVKLAKAAQAYPEDQTIGQMANITSRMADSDKLFITRAEVKDLYNKLYTRNNKFPELFVEELGEIKRAAKSTLYNRDGDDENYSIINKAYEKIVDPNLANALHSAFGTAVKPFTDIAVKSAKDICIREFNSFGIKVSSLEVVNGRDDLVICTASFETPKGSTSIFLPVEIVGSKALIPSVFVGNRGPEDLTKENLIGYIVRNAGDKLTLNDSIVFQAAAAAKDQDSNEISSVDLALIKLNSQKETQGNFFENQIVYQKMEDILTDVEVNTPYYRDPEVASFAKALESPLGVASFTHTAAKVNLGRNIISRQLSNFGLDNPQIAVCDSDVKTIVYAVSLNGGKTGFKVPLKVENTNVLNPSVFISNGSLNIFSRDNIFKLFTQEDKDYKALAAASPLHDLRPSDLTEIVREAMLEDNFAKAEDALNILSQRNDAKAYQTAFTAYTEGLAGITKEVSAESTCSMVVKNAHSKHLLCGHTNLPLHKVYQDKNGDCHPAYRKGMDESYEGAYFMNAKIFG